MATVKGTAKTDKFTVNTSNVIVVTGKKSSTKKISKNGKNRIYGAAAKDTFTVKGGKLNYIYGDAGNDTITITSKIGSGNRIYGDDAKNKVSSNDTFNINSGSKNYFYGGKGTDTFNINGGNSNYLYGGAGKDTYFFGKKKATATIKDYAAGQDTLNVNSGIITSTTLNGKDITFKAGKASVTLTGAATKTISLKDSRGSYTVSNTAIIPGKDFQGTMDATKYLSTVIIIDGRNTQKKVNISGNAKANTIYAGKAGGTIKGDKGNDTIYAGAGVDILYGGAGKDIFVYADSEGGDTIMDYSADDDLIQVSKGIVTKRQTVNGGKDVKYTIGSGSITVKNGAGKSIRIVSGSGETVQLLGDFGGTFSASGHFSTVKNIYGTIASKPLTIIGNGKENIIIGGKENDKLYGGAGNDKLGGFDGNDELYGEAGNDELEGGAGNDKLYGGDGNDELYGGAGNDILTGGAGKDFFDACDYNSGHDTITDYTEGEDTIYLGYISKTVLVNEGKDLKFVYDEIDDPTCSTTVIGGGDKTITLFDGCNTFTASGTEVVLGSGFSAPIHGDNFLDTVITFDGRLAVSSEDYTMHIWGNKNDNFIYGGVDTDNLYGNDGNDKIYGGAGDDRLYGGVGNDVLDGGAGDDTLDGGEGSDWLYGGAGDNSLYGDFDDNARDTFYFDSQSTGKNLISYFTPGTNAYSDMIKFGSGASVSKYYNESFDAILELSNGGIIRIYNAAQQIIQVGGNSLDFSNLD